MCRIALRKQAREPVPAASLVAEKGDHEITMVTEMSAAITATVEVEQMETGLLHNEDTALNFLSPACITARGFFLDVSIRFLGLSLPGHLMNCVF